MKTSIVSTAYFTFRDYESGLAKLKAHGYDATDYQGLVKMDSELYSLSNEEIRVFLTRVRASADKHGVDIKQVHGLWPTVGDDKTAEDRQKTREYFVRQIEYAHYLGAKYLVVHPVMPIRDGKDDSEETFLENERMLRSLIPHAEKWDVTVCIENMPFINREISKVSVLKRLVRLINHPKIKICLDTGHANIFHDDLGEDVRLLGDDLAVIHVHDNHGRNDAHLLPYFGTTEWESFLTALGEVGFKGYFNLETRIPEKMPEPCREEMRLSLSRLASYMADKASSNLKA
ncbi:MAG: sugar phosphate isomerase/epimerase [Clostridia bacterium]|nr:sugar phosphate isomerase/epimerase [Clostridia bacterium]